MSIYCFWHKHSQNAESLLLLITKDNRTLGYWKVTKYISLGQSVYACYPHVVQNSVHFAVIFNAFHMLHSCCLEKRQLNPYCSQAFDRVNTLWIISNMKIDIKPLQLCFVWSAWNKNCVKVLPWQIGNSFPVELFFCKQSFPKSKKNSWDK